MLVFGSFGPFLQCFSLILTSRTGFRAYVAYFGILEYATILEGTCSEFEEYPFWAYFSGTAMCFRSTRSVFGVMPTAGSGVPVAGFEGTSTESGEYSQQLCRIPAADSEGIYTVSKVYLQCV